MRRHKINLMQEILTLCYEPRKITEIMRLANVAYLSFDKHVEPLVKKGFLIKVPCPKSGDKKTKYKWMTTAKGKVLVGEIGAVLGQVEG